LGGCQDVGALNDVWLRERDRLLDHLPSEGLPPGIQLWIRHPVEPWCLRKHLPEVWIVIESMQWQLHLARQRLCERRLPSTACPCDKNMLLSTALKLAGSRPLGGWVRPQLPCERCQAVAPRVECAQHSFLSRSKYRFLARSIFLGSSRWRRFGFSTLSDSTTSIVRRSPTARRRCNHFTCPRVRLSRPPTSAVSSSSILSPSRLFSGLRRTQVTFADSTPKSRTPAVQTCFPFNNTLNATTSFLDGVTPPVTGRRERMRVCRPLDWRVRRLSTPDHEFLPGLQAP